MRALITGAAGFVGKYLISHLVSLGWEVSATRLPAETLDAPIPVYELDILDSDAVCRLLDTVQPEGVFHLAAQSSVALSWKKPALTADINIKGTIHVLEAVRRTQTPPRLLLIGSSEEYGVVPPDMLPISEDIPARPPNVYSVTKAAQGMLGKVYAEAYGLDCIMTKSFNHIGPGQAGSFVVSSFCKQVAEIEAGYCPPVIRTGNLEAKRDFTDVRDIVRAYAMLMQSGKRGATYNIGSGKSVAIAEILDIILSLSDKTITIEQDAERLRPSDMPDITADITRLTRLTGWKPEIPLRDTLTDTMKYWREIGRTGV